MVRRALSVWLVCGGCVTTAVAPVGDTDVTPPVRFALPVEDGGALDGLIGVDHDPVVQTTRAEELICEDYLGRVFPHCYDEHEGSDFLLAGGFAAMDAGSLRIIAAAAGEVVRTHDGEYDRCHGTLDGVDCDGHEAIANSVTLEHEDGTRTLYWHMLKDSVAVTGGQLVERGDVLGLVGSSGWSSLPHLHFEVQDVEGQTVDPYAADAKDSMWCEQGGPDELPGPCGL